ncbi:hypothetical protein CEQ90_00510 [Lewinellaceae bacterium SD302]|nr:hypothetical protein CEQ90_00510 [Lewinellaceae bacterium SD302]
MHYTLRLLLLLLPVLIFSACDRENYDEVISETTEPIEPEVTDYSPDHVYFNTNGYVSSDLADASECEFEDPFSGEMIRYYLITNTGDHQSIEPELEEEGEFYLYYDFEDQFYNHANIVVEIADTLTLACPITLNFEFEQDFAEDHLVGHFDGEFFIFNNAGTAIESIGDLSGNFHIPMVECQ